MINIRQSFTHQTFMNDLFKDFPCQTFALYGTIDSYSVNYAYGSVADSGMLSVLIMILHLAIRDVTQ